MLNQKNLENNKKWMQTNVQKKKNFFLGLTQCDIKKLGYSNNLIYRYAYIYKCIFAGIIVYNITIVALSNANNNRK